VSTLARGGLEVSRRAEPWPGCTIAASCTDRKLWVVPVGTIVLVKLLFVPTVSIVRSTTAGSCVSVVSVFPLEPRSVVDFVEASSGGIVGASFVAEATVGGGVVGSRRSFGVL
jgi:hypothetical protein